MRLTPSDTTVALRAAIKAVLDTATTPLTSSQICDHPAVASLNVAKADATLAVAHLFMLKSRGFLMMRSPIGGGKFVYFNPDVVVPDTEVMAAAQDMTGQGHVPQSVNLVNSGDFAFNPIGFAGEIKANKPAGRRPGSKNKPKMLAGVPGGPAINESKPAENFEVPVRVLPGVKCITLTVAGVSIKIELG